MDTNKMEDAAHEATGTLQQAVGNVVDDVSTAAAVKARELREKANKLCSDTSTLVRTRTTESPLTALGIAALIGFLVGVMRVSGRRTSNTPAARRRVQHEVPKD